jgi:hypothetical protein
LRQNGLHLRQDTRSETSGRCKRKHLKNHCQS